MKKPTKAARKAVLPEYDFSQAVRGKHFRRYHRGANVVLLAPDVAKAFPTAEAVNDSLRALANIIHQQGKLVAEKA